jgi:transposase
MTYPLSFRKKVFSIKASEGLTYEETSKRFGIGKTTLVRWHQRLEPLMNRNKPATKVDMNALKQDIEDHPDSYQHERAERLKVSQAGIWYALKRLGITYKKNTTASQSGSRKTICILPNS